MSDDGLVTRIVSDPQTTDIAIALLARLTIKTGRRTTGAIAPMLRCCPPVAKTREDFEDLRRLPRTSCGRKRSCRGTCCQKFFAIITLECSVFRVRLPPRPPPNRLYREELAFSIEPRCHSVATCVRVKLVSVC
jgi:hypothetical protein